MGHVNPHQSTLSLDAVRRVAVLSRLALSDEQITTYQQQLGSVLEHIKMLGELDLKSVEPMAHPLESANRWDEDDPRVGLSNAALMGLAPAKAEPFIVVPKVLGGGSGA